MLKPRGENFYITGLPRSRTAWCSRLFSFGNVYCLHDACIRDGWRDELKSLPFAKTGVSDCGLSIMPELPEGKWLVIKRNPVDSLRSFLAMPEYPHIGPLDPLGSARAVLNCAAGLQRIEKERDALVVAYEDLDKRDAVRAAWDHLIGDVQPWSETHWNEMRHLRVQVVPSSYEVM